MHCSKYEQKIKQYNNMCYEIFLAPTHHTTTILDADGDARHPIIDPLHGRLQGEEPKFFQVNEVNFKIKLLKFEADTDTYP